jgi:hypothetical protein
LSLKAKDEVCIIFTKLTTLKSKFMFNLFKPTNRLTTVSKVQSIVDSRVSELGRQIKEAMARRNQSTIDQYTAENRKLKAKLAALEQFLGVEYVEESTKSYRKVKVTRAKKTK